jgi:hypothetical protein
VTLLHRCSPQLLAIALLLMSCGDRNAAHVFASTDASPQDADTQSTTLPIRTISLSDNGQTLQLQVGDTFALDLPDTNTVWQVQVGDQTVVAPAPDITGSATQEGYRALATGSTQLVATGAPPCATVDPPCRVMAVEFRLIIVVS